MNAPFDAYALPSIHSLVAFEAVARLRSVSRAARELGITRSALGHSIGLLEHRLRVRLFASLTPGAQLTPAGQLYYAAVHRFARTIGDGLYVLSPAARAPLRVSASPGMARLWLGPRLASFAQRHPRIDLMLSVGEDLADVAGDRVDVALRYGGGDESGTVATVLWPEAIGAVAAPEVAQCAARMRVDELVTAFPLLEHRMWDWRRWLLAQGGPPLAHEPAIVCHDASLLLEAAAAGHGIALVPLTLTARFRRDGRLAVAHAATVPGKPYRIVVRDAQPARPAVAAFTAWLADEAARDAAPPA